MRSECGLIFSVFCSGRSVLYFNIHKQETIMRFFFLKGGAVDTSAALSSGEASEVL